MLNDTIRLRDVVQVELEQLEQYGEAAAEYFHSLSGEIRSEFTGTLEELLTHDLVAFQAQVNRSLSGSGMGGLANPLGDMLAGVVGGFMPDNMFGEVFGAAIGGALRTAVRDLERHGSVDMRRVVQSANRSGDTRLNRAIRQGDIPMSNSQRSAGMWEELTHGRRNL